MSDPDDVEAVLDERPDLEAPLEAVLAVDDEHDSWTFDDVPVESGPFGELVGRDVVESVGDEYRLTDPAGVRIALTDGDAGTISGSRSTPTPTLPDLSFPSVDRTTALLVAAAVAFVGVVRSHPVASIYRNDDIVFSGNDPYAYRYYVEQFLGGGGVPDSMLNSEPLLVWTLGSISSLFGGEGPAQHVMAWYPVVAAVIGALFVYLIAVRVTSDRRVGVAAVLFFGLIPGHALRTSVGYADHHAFDYVWLAATALAVTHLADVDRETLRARRTWLVVLGMGIAVAGQVLAWEAGPLLVAPLGLIVAGRAALDVKRGDSPLPAGVPVVAGVGVGALIAVVAHLLTDFQTTAVILAPAVVAVGSAGALGLALLAHRMAWGSRLLIAAYAVAGVAGIVLLAVALTPVWDVLVTRLDTLFRSDGIAETQGLFDPSSFGFLFLFGLALFLALPPMVWALWRSREDGRWLVVTTYAWYFLLLAAIQVRFVGELGTFAAVFAGFGFVWVAAWVDAIPWPTGDVDPPAPLRVPDRRVLAALIVLFVLFGSFGAMQVVIKTDQVVIENDVYESAAFIDDHAADRDLEYPENYVLSGWGRNRVYNYFANGESASYGYAFNNYEDFAGGTDPDSWYDEFDGRVGYVVLDRDYVTADPSTTIRRLSTDFGSADGNDAGVGHYRALHVPEGESKAVFAVVPGANVTGSGDTGGDVELWTSVAGEGLSFRYERQTSVGDDGEWTVRVAQPGNYTVVADGDRTSVEVPEDAVESGEGVSVG